VAVSNLNSTVIQQQKVGLDHDAYSLDTNAAISGASVRIWGRDYTSKSKH